MTRRILWLLGLVLIGYGLHGLLTAASGPDPLRYLGFAAAAVIGHDLLLAPLALAAGGLVAHLTPSGLRGLVVAALFTSLTVTLVALPFVLGYGRKPDNPSVLPLDYGRNLALIVAAIWLCVATAGTVRWLAARRDDSAGRDDSV
jgi:hypothetical protein